MASEAKEAREQQLQAIQAASDAQQLVLTAGWEKLVEPFLSEWEAQATRAVMGNPDVSGSREQFLKGGAALAQELRQFLSQTIANASDVLAASDGESPPDSDGFEGTISRRF